MNQFWITALITFFTTIAGAFIGVFLKEFFADEFIAKRRKRELKTTIVKNLVKYFTLSKNSPMSITTMLYISVV